MCFIKEVFKSYMKSYSKIYVRSALHMVAFLNQNVAEKENVCFMSQNLTPATAGISTSLQLLDNLRSPRSQWCFVLSEPHGEGRVLYFPNVIFLLTTYIHQLVMWKVNQFVFLVLKGRRIYTKSALFIVIIWKFKKYLIKWQGFFFLNNQTY